MFYLHTKFHDKWISSFRGVAMTRFWDGRTDRQTYGRSDCIPRPAFAFGDAGKNYGEIQCIALLLLLDTNFVHEHEKSLITHLFKNIPDLHCIPSFVPILSYAHMHSFIVSSPCKASEMQTWFYQYIIPVDHILMMKRVQN